MAGVQGPPGPVQRVSRTGAVAVQVLLDAASTSVEGIAGETDGVKRALPK